MSRRTVVFSDLSEQQVPDDQLVKIRVLDHSAISAPVELDASRHEVEVLVKNAKSFVLMEVREADQAPMRYALDQADFDSASQSPMAEVLKQATAVREEAPEPTRRRGRPSKSADTAPTRGRERDYDMAALRAWASSNNIQVPQRGRIPQHIVDQYKAAGN